MNLLFFTTNKISPTMGGVENATLRIAQELHTHYHCKCYSAFYCNNNSPDFGCFDEEILVSGRDLISELYQIIRAYSIDVVLSESLFEVTICVDKLRKESKLSLGNVFVHHFAPGWESNFFKMKHYMDVVKLSKGMDKITSSIRFLFYPYFRLRYLHRIPVQYRYCYQAADKVVLLSSSFISLYENEGRFKDSSKFEIISNCLMLDEFYPREKLSEKKHIALIVARLDEIQKRISLALKIWKEVKRHAQAKDWLLNIVGGGDTRFYENLIKQQGIKDVNLLGRQIPNKYYKESSIFLMTSKSEGFALTLIEAQQMGVVPIAFDSYPALKDIISNEENGIIVPECNVDDYVDKLLWLMEHSSDRKEMASKALDTVHKFDKDTISAKWYNLLVEVMNLTEDYAILRN